MKSLALLLALAPLGASASYDPLVLPKETAESITLEVRDAQRERTLPLRVYLPASPEPAPVVLFSHGLGGSKDNNPYLGEHWAGRGYLAIFVQHPGSDESVWKNQRPAGRMGAMKEAANGRNHLDRNRDIPAVLDALEMWNAQKDHALHSRLDLEKVGMSGHSFGARTTQAMAGQAGFRPGSSTREPRIDAAVMMSPSPPSFGDPGRAFATIDIPCLLLTGTEDDSPIGGGTPEDRLKVFPHLNKAPAWQLVFEGGDHAVFSGHPRRDGQPRDPRFHRAILALTTAFWDATLRDDKDALAWLNSPAVRKVLTEADRFEINRRP